jgi:Lar family restriction alleviation protein
MTKLKPCPFCGSINLSEDALRSVSSYWISCDDCLANGPTSEVDNVEAVELWNSRDTEK